MAGKLTLGPLMYNWSADKRRDFYCRIADEAAVDTVCLGEVICPKRLPFYEADLPDIAERLVLGGKEVVFSSLALIQDRRDGERLRAQLEDAGFAIEANDVAAVSLLEGRTFDVGPFVNVYNEGTLKYLIGRGARRVCLPAELGREALAALAAVRSAELEVQAFGRMPLAVSARCYHARAHRLSKDACQFVCDRDPDGMPVRTLDGRAFLAVNGIQTLSHGYLNLLADVPDMTALGIGRFRLHPQDGDMVRIARAFRDVLDGALSPGEAEERLRGALCDDVRFANGYFHGREGDAWVGPRDKAGKGA
jgi:collagenase-like PrtC family protease